MEDDWEEDVAPSGGAGRGFSDSNGDSYRPGGGRGGFARGGRDDGEGGGGGYRGGRRDDNGGGRGGYRGRRDDDEEGGGRGGYRGRREDGEEGGGGGRGGYRGRREDGEEGGGGGRGGYRGRREDGEEGGGGGRGGFRGRRDDGEGGGGYRGRREDGEGGGGFRGRRDDGEGEEGGRRPRRNGDENGENGEGDEDRPKPVTYIPPEPTDNPEEMFGSGISSGINFAKYDKIEVKVSGENAPKAISNFGASGLRQMLLDNVKRSGYKTPTPVQKYALPIIMAGRDLMASAQTGSGKTAAFILPILHKLLAEPVELVVDGEHTEPQAVIVSPTRELTVQIFSEARKFASESILKVAVAYGGTAARHQADKIRFGCHVLVATPGRLMDFVNRGRITFSSVRFVVLDEADRMLDMGFLPEMERMMSHPTMVPTGERQTLMFSATFPEEVQSLARKFLNEYVFLAVGPVGGANSDVIQTIIEVESNKKRDTLMDILDQISAEDKVVVFCETKKRADFLAGYLSQKNLPSTSIHGDREQREREEALRDFTKGNKRILVATSVAARGLDIKGVSHVINFEMPKSVDEYVHRIGRTGRVGNIGKATSFYDSTHDSNLAGDLAKILRDAGQEVPPFLEGFAAVESYSSGSRDIRGGGQTHVLEQEEESWD